MTLQDFKSDGEDTPAFGAGGIRIGFKGQHTKEIASKLQVDFNREHQKDPKEGTLPEIIKDMVIYYKFRDEATVAMGQFKSPFGMDFNAAGTKLDIPVSGPEKRLVFERALGAMLSGQKIAGGFGYDLGVFNPSGRGIGTKNGGKKGMDQMWVARLSFDRPILGMDQFHAETSYGSSSSSVAGKEDITAVDAAIKAVIAALTLKFEYLAASDLNGTKGVDEQVWYAHMAYLVHPMLEGVVRHYQSTEDTTHTELGSTFIGVNLFFDPECHHCARLMVHYMVAGGDKSNYAGTAFNTKDDGAYVQFQIAF